MAWETRNGRGSYYTRSRRVGGRVVREYIGMGPLAEMIAAEDAERHSVRQASRAARESCKAELERAAGLVDRSWRRASSLVEAVLVSNGYHRHHRGEWRKRRV